LTAARSSANSVYVPPLLQAELDQQSGIVYAQETDYRTSFSYFFEAFEGYHNLHDPRAGSAFHCMLLCKMMGTLPEEVLSLIHSKADYADSVTAALKAVALAYQRKDLHAFEAALREHTALAESPLVYSHI